MKAHTQTFKDNLTTLGKEINAKVTYTIDSVETELSGDELGSVTPHYEGNILKSVMKQVDIVSDVDIPLNTEINVQFGMRYNTETYEYIDYGNYVVNKSEKQEDTNNYKIIAYDKMLYAMKDYEELDITYPITIRDYINAICTKIGLTFANINDTFANYDKEITQDLYKDLGYTYRDILTELAQVTASTICINKDDELEVRYINQAVAESEQLSGTSFDLESDDAPLGIDEFDGEITQETTTGKNLLDTSLLPLSNHGLTISRNNNGDIVINGTPDYSSGYVSFRLGNGKTLTPNTYTLSVNTKKVGIGMSVGGFGGRLNLTLADTVKSKTQTSTENYYIQPDLNIRYDVGTLNNFILNPQLEISSTPTSYEPYTNGASPNPNYPQDIEITTGRQEVDIRGKNFFDNNVTKTTQGNSSVLNETNLSTGKRITYTGTTTLTNSCFAVYSLFDLTPYIGKTIRFKTDFIVSSSNKGSYYIGLCNANGSNRAVKKQSNTSGSIVDFVVPTLQGEQTYLCLALYANASTGGTLNTNDYIDFTNMMVTINDEDLTYEPYKGKEHEINLGKNLLKYPYKDTTKTTGGITFTDNENGTITANGTATANAYFFYYPNTNGQRLPLKQGTYTFSSNIPSGVTVAFGFRDNDGNIISGVSGLILNSNTTSGTRTINQDFEVFASIMVSNGTTINNFEIKSQLEKGNVATSYSSYFEPIFLGKINTYKDFIRRGTGKNLFDKDNLTRINGTINVGTNSYFRGGGANYAVVIPCEPNTTYTVQKRNDGDTNRFAVASSETIPSGSADVDTTLPNAIRNDNASSITITTSSNAKYLVVNYYRNVETLITDQQLRDSIQIELETQATEYEPYGFKDKWYLYKTIGKVVLNGSENSWANAGTNTTGYNRWRVILDNPLPATSISSVVPTFCNTLTSVTVANTYSRKQGIGIDVQNNYAFFYIDDVASYTLANFKTWLASNNLIVYYVLNTPTITEITNNNYPELYSQLKAIEKARTFEGVTYIDSTTPISIDYIKQLETFNEDYIKNTRADFGEKYGPINSVVLSRSAESDNIYLKDQESIDENGLCEVKIKDNQIMNDNNRDQYLPDLLEYLKQVEYYINDFESIGITYLDLLDRYKVIIGDKSYYCVMLNDEVGIHDGLNEIIYTEKPKEEVTEYKKASTTDKQARQTYLMVDKQAQRIDALVSDEEENFSRIQVEIDNISSQVQSTNVELDNLGNEINVVRSSISEQTSEAITDWFNTALKPTIEDLENSVDSNDQTLNEIKSYVRRGVITDPQSPYYNQAFVELGDTTNQTTLRILPNRIQFLTNGQETAFISNNQLYINESTILTKEKIGNWVTTQDENGLLNTYWED